MVAYDQPFAKDYIQPKGIRPSTYYSDAISTYSGRTIYIAGQTAYDDERDYQDLNFEEQVEQALSNMSRVLEASGATPADVVQIRVYIKDYKETHLQPLSKALSNFFPKDRPPTSTLIGVQSLAREVLLFEIEAIAVVP